MNAVEVSKRSIDAWNRHDADAVIALYAEEATYHTPRFDHPLKGKALADFIKSVLTAFPDLRFEVISRWDTGGGLVALQLVLHGTHNGSFMDGTPPAACKKHKQWWRRMTNLTFREANKQTTNPTPHTYQTPRSLANGLGSHTRSVQPPALNSPNRCRTP
jgi:steroid delta-isomerase-like uncharacterized protein